MLIGGNFNKKSREFLHLLASVSENNAGEKVSVSSIIDQFDLDKAELRSMMEYLESLDCLKIETIGGPYLYGHVSITQKGLEKATRL